MSLKHLADELAARGRYGDTELVHMTKGEVAGLQSLAEAAGGSLTVNPDTGKPEAFFLAALLPTILGGVGASMGLGALGTAALGAGVGALQAKSQGRSALMGAITGGMGGVGGGQLANALTNAGTTAAQMSAVQGATAAGDAATQQAMQELATRQAMAQGSQLTGAEAAQAAIQGIKTPPIDLTAPNLDAIRNQAMGDFYKSATPSGLDAVGQGITALGTQAGRDAAMQSLGGGAGALKTAGMAATPYLYESMLPKPVAIEEDDTELPRYDYTAGLTGDYYGVGGDNSTRERGYFTQPTFTRRAAQGGIMQLAEGGETEQQDVAKGMTGASADAMRYLMGQTQASPATVAQQQAIQSARNAAPAAMQVPQATPISGSSDRQFVYDPYTHSVVRNSSYVDPEIARRAAQAKAEENSSNTLGGYFNDGNAGFADGGLASLARGGMKAGGFVIPADVVSMVGEGNTEAGYKDLARALPGATPIRGKDGGQADTVKTSIEGKQPARVAHGEMYVPPATVKRVGGAKKLYAMMDKVRKQATGNKKQIKPVDLRKALA